MFDPHENLARIKHLTNSVVPFSHTVANINGNLTFDLKNGGSIGVGLFKTKEVAILVATFDADSTHRSHFHNEKEILILIEGQAEVVVNNGIQYLQKGDSITIEPGTAHEINFPVRSEMISITIPASEDYPNVDRK